jgi:hypothetical protein
VEFVTFSHPAFTAVYRQFYLAGSPGTRPQKVIPADIATWLTPRVLAYHVMCDGTWQRGALVLHTQSFRFEDCARYADALAAGFGLHPTVRHARCRGRTYPVLAFPVADGPLLRTLLGPHMLPSFAYKLGLGPA